MSDSIYMDQYHRTWQKVVIPSNGKHWLMLASHNGYTPGDFTVGGYYSDDQLSKYKVKLNSVVKGASYEFPPEFKPGDDVWIDEQWFESDATSRVAGWIGSPGRIAGKVEKVNRGATSMIVNVPISIPLSKITKQQ